VYKLGARATFELVDELTRCYPEIAGDLGRRLANYVQRLNPELSAVTGRDSEVSPV
jgi:hypothetical protein